MGDAKKGGQLHQVLAVVNDRKAAANKILAETRHTFTSKRQHFLGVLKTYEPREEGGETQPGDLAPMTTTVGEKLAHLISVVSPWIDAQYQVDATNMEAVANLTIDGETLLWAMPGTALLQLDKTVKMLREVFDSLPTLDPKYEWKADTKRGAGVYKANDTEVNRTKKKIVPQVLAPATDRHPAQVEKIVEDVVIGSYTTRRWSGELTPAEKADLLRRLDTLGQAIRQALSRANQQAHSTARIGEALFQYLFKGVALSREQK